MRSCTYERNLVIVRHWSLMELPVHGAARPGGTSTSGPTSGRTLGVQVTWQGQEVPSSHTVLGRRVSRNVRSGHRPPCDLARFVPWQATSGWAAQGGRCVRFWSYSWRMVAVFTITSSCRGRLHTWPIQVTIYCFAEVLCVPILLLALHGAWCWRKHATRCNTGAGLHTGLAQLNSREGVRGWSDEAMAPCWRVRTVVDV